MLVAVVTLSLWLSKPFETPCRAYRKHMYGFTGKHYRCSKIMQKYFIFLLCKAIDKPKVKYIHQRSIYIYIYMSE